MDVTYLNSDSMLMTTFNDSAISTLTAMYAGAIVPLTEMYDISLEPEFYVLQGGGAEFLKKPPKIAKNSQKPPKDLKISIKAFPMPAETKSRYGNDTTYQQQLWECLLLLNP